MINPTANNVNGWTNRVSSLMQSTCPWNDFPQADLLRICRATEDDLRSFVDLFARGRPWYLVTKWGQHDPGEWYLEKQELADSMVLWHLLGDVISPCRPRWVGPWSTEKTQWIAFDVDFQDDEQEFQKRCEAVQQMLERLGISREACLVSRTPSGGKHIRFFLSEPVRVDDVAPTMGRTGQEFTKGRIELFPSPRKGLRLPFGLLPNSKHDPTEWVQFIRKWKGGLIKRFDWDEIKSRLNTSDNCPGRDSGSILSERGSTSLPALSAAEIDALLGIDRPNSTEPQAAPPDRRPCLQHQHSTSSQSSVDEYLQLLTGPRTRHTAEALWKCGIQAPRTRVSATERVACHLVRFQNLPCKVAEDQIVEWVYRTGRDHSNDVKRDLLQGTRKVEEQTRKFVQWFHANRKERQDHDKRFTPREIAALSDVLRKTPRPLSCDSIDYALRMFHFAKANGWSSLEGIECQIATTVMNRWPCNDGRNRNGCIRQLQDAGLIAMTREAVPSDNGTGQARTYLIRVRPDREDPETIDLTDAIFRICSKLGLR
jgi:hypothetical protein